MACRWYLQHSGNQAPRGPSAYQGRIKAVPTPYQHRPVTVLVRCWHWFAASQWCDCGGVGLHPRRAVQGKNLEKSFCKSGLQGLSLAVATDNRWQYKVFIYRVVGPTELVAAKKDLSSWEKMYIFAVRFYWGISSFGRAVGSQSTGNGFDSRILHTDKSVESGTEQSNEYRHFPLFVYTSSQREPINEIYSAYYCYLLFYFRPACGVYGSGQRSQTVGQPLRD